MKHRADFSPEQRKARSELMKLIHDKGFIRANPVMMSRVCGNPNCRCKNPADQVIELPEKKSCHQQQKDITGIF
jgi:hypothetical protein